MDYRHIALKKEDSYKRIIYAFKKTNVGINPGLKTKGIELPH